MVNKIRIKPNGPIIVQGNLRLEDADGNLLKEDSELYLCRCGNTKNPPYCDGSHKTSPEMNAEFVDEKAEELTVPGPLIITVRKNAMLIVKGPMEITSMDGQSHTTRNKAALCRCGHSDNKPFCDASHKRCGFNDSSSPAA